MSPARRLLFIVARMSCVDDEINSLVNSNVLADDGWHEALILSRRVRLVQKRSVSEGKVGQRDLLS